MTTNEARIARIAFHLAEQDMERYCGQAANPELLRKFIEKYQDGLPCHYLPECVLNGQCPREIACDN
jgi:hypothetical protein